MPTLELPLLLEAIRGLYFLDPENFILSAIFTSSLTATIRMPARDLWSCKRLRHCAPVGVKRIYVTSSSARCYAQSSDFLRCKELRQVFESKSERSVLLECGQTTLRLCCERISQPGSQCFFKRLSALLILIGFQVRHAKVVERFGVQRLPLRTLT